MDTNVARVANQLIVLVESGDIDVTTVDMRPSPVIETVMGDVVRFAMSKTHERASGDPGDIVYEVVITARYVPR